MSARQFELNEHDCEIIRQAVASGEYATESEVVSAALSKFDMARAAPPTTLAIARLRVQEGFEQFERGEYTSLSTSEDVDAFMDKIEAKYKTPEAG